MRMPITPAGVGASRIRLPMGTWPLLLDFLDQRFPDVGRQTWELRMRQGKVSDANAVPLSCDAPFVAGGLVHYYRELPRETPIPFSATLLHSDEHLLVVDKPHFLPTMPAGRFVQESLLVRLKQQTGIDSLVPLHRLDRATAGLVLFSVKEESRAAYSALFSSRSIDKVYEALAPATQDLVFPMIRRSRIVTGEPFFRMREVEGTANAETLIDRMDALGNFCRYRLHPMTGKKHQLRVHMAAIGLPILNDCWYPDLLDENADDYAQPLKLLARNLSFIDPLSGENRRFESRLQL